MVGLHTREGNGFEGRELSKHVAEFLNRIRSRIPEHETAELDQLVRDPEQESRYG